MNIGRNTLQLGCVIPGCEGEDPVFISKSFDGRNKWISAGSQQQLIVGNLIPAGQTDGFLLAVNSGHFRIQQQIDALLLVEIIRQVGHAFFVDQTTQQVRNQRPPIGIVLFTGNNGDVALLVQTSDSTDSPHSSN